MKKLWTFLLALGFSSGALADLQVTPTLIDFGAVRPAKQRSVKRVRVTNWGEQTITNLTITDYYDPAFRVSHNCHWDLEPNEWCHLTIYFIPLQEGYFSSKN